MAQFYEIPTGPSARTLSTVLAGQTYSLRLAYAEAPEGGWFIDIADDAGKPLIAGLMLTSGPDLLQPYPNLGIKAKLYLVPDAGAGPLSYDNLGLSWHLIFTES